MRQPDGHEPHERHPVVRKKLNDPGNLAQLEIGGVNFSIKGPGKTPLLLREHDPTYGEFFKKENRQTDQTPGTIPVNININLELGNLPGTGKLTKIFDTRQSWMMYREGDTYWLALHPPAREKPFWAARFNREIKEVTVFCSERFIQKSNGKTTILNPVRYPLDQLLIMYILAGHQGAVIHAAGMEMKGKGFIFAGPSGAGKGTLARLFNAAASQNHPKTVVLSDERIVTRKINGAFKAYGTPWHGQEASARDRCVPLAGIFFLNHGNENTLSKLKPRQALEKLLKVTSIPWYDRDVMPGVLLFCEELITRVPLFELHFTPGIEVVRFLENHAADIYC